MFEPSSIIDPRNRSMQLVLITDSPVEQQEIVVTLSSLAVDVQTFRSVSEFRQQCTRTPYSGVVVAFRMLRGLSTHDKLFLNELENSFPILRVVRQAGTQTYNGITQGSMMSKGESIFQFFVEEKCLKFHARGVRKEVRCRVNLRLMISPSREMKDWVRRACTYNVSENGMFIIEPEVRENGTDIWLTAAGFDDPTPMRGRVCWRSPWSASTGHLPGYGILIQEWTTAQRQQMAQFVSRAALTMLPKP